MKFDHTSTSQFGFEVQATDGLARAGVVTTAHGPMETPAFMVVGTVGTVKAMTADAVRSTGTQCVLGNTYHLMLRPGAERTQGRAGRPASWAWSGPSPTVSNGSHVPC